MLSFRPTSHSLLLLWSLLLHGVCASQDDSQPRYPPYDYGIDRSAILKRQSSNHYAITGIHTGSGPGGSAPLRLEIRELEKDQTTWALYILALDMLQNTDQTEMLSWYQIAGIHGRPYIPFDNVQAKAGNENNGYCTHVSILFPTWHRPYLALYEQVLHGMAQRIAQQYPSGSVRDKYVAAAANFRIPYWDWAIVPANGGGVLPSSVRGSSVTVDGPAGTQTIKNPLFSYEFKPLNTAQLPDPPMNQYNETKRYPNTQTSSAQSQNDLVAQQLDNNAATLRNRLYNLFTNYNDYTSFSNEGEDPNEDPSKSDSIESVHDLIHGLVGNGGHMGFVDYSAFDPLFFLHHTMVDRCFALWQVINPGSYVVAQKAIYPTYTNSRGDILDSTSPLTPFHADASGTFWTSDAIRNTSTFGYAYPETAASAGVNVTAQVISAVNKLYGRTSNPPKKLKSRDIPAVHYHEWIANIRVKKMALNRPFFIHIFLGDFNPDPASWSFESNLVGTHCIFTKASMQSSSCTCDPDQLVTATIPLTEALLAKVDKGELKSLDPQDAVIYISKNIKYRITNFDDTEVGNGDVPSMKVSVASVVVRGTMNELEFPKWGEMKGHMDVGTC